MKTKNTIKLALAAFVVFFCFAQRAHAQLCLTPSGYAINNNNLYPVTVSWEIVDANCKFVSAGGPVNIGPGGGPYMIPSWMFSGAADIYINLTEVNGDLTGAPSVNGTAIPNCNTGTANTSASGSTASGYSWSITWGCGGPAPMMQTTIN